MKRRFDGSRSPPNGKDTINDNTRTMNETDTTMTASASASASASAVASHTGNGNTSPSQFTDVVTSIDDAIDKIGTGKFQRQILIAVGTCFMADSMEVILLSFLIIVLKEEWDWGGDGDGEGDEGNGNNADQQLANITAVMFAGALFGTYILGPMGDRIGRKPVTLIAALIISLGGLITGMCNNYTSLLLVRFIVGFGVGGVTVPFDILTEFLPTKDRGRFLMYTEYFWTAGSMLVPVVAFLTLELVGSWRVFVIVCAIPCAISALCSYLFVPESPRWLVVKGREEEALDILRKGAAINGKDPRVLFPSHCRIREEITEEVSDYAELFKPRWRRITVLLFFVWWGFALGYYGTILIVTKVFDENQNDIGGGDDGVNEGEKALFDYSAIFISSSAEIVGTALATYLIDRVGRIPTQACSFLTGGISLFFLCFLFGHAGRNTLVTLAFIARTCEMLGSSVTWVSTAEIYSTEIRSTGHSATNAIARIGGFASPYLVAGGTSYQKIGITMLIVNLITAICASRLPETKGKDLGQVAASGDYDDMDSYPLTETELI